MVARPPRAALSRGSPGEELASDATSEVATASDATEAKPTALAPAPPPTALARSATTAIAA